MKRTTTWAVLALTAATLTLSACSVPDIEDKPPAAVADTKKDKPAEEETTPPPAPEPAPAEAGTRDNPFPKGTTVGTDEVEIVFGEVTWNATDIVAAENQFNDPAPEGSTYALLPVTITNLASADAVTPGYAFSVSFVADDGRSFEQSYVVIPNDISSVDDLYTGGVGSGNIAFALPNEVSAGGTWAVQESFGFGDPVFIAAH